MRALLVLLALTTTASANVGRPWMEGSPVGEPNGLEDVAIVHEDLAFDLRPLDDHGSAHVRAAYRIDNRGATVTRTLVFAAGASGHDLALVRLDGTLLQYAPYNGDVPWPGPKVTPSLTGGSPLFYDVDHPLAASFEVTLSPGPHVLEVQFSPTAQSNRSARGGTLLWQLGYALSPARTWGGFGDLDVTVQLPDGWRAAIEPAMTRDGDTLRAHFDHLPADTIGMTVQAPDGALNDAVYWGSPVVLALVLIVLPFVLARVRVPALLGGMGYAAAVGVASYLFWFRDTIGIPEHQSAYYGYGQIFGALFSVVLVVAAIPAGYVLCARMQTRAVQT